MHNDRSFICNADRVEKYEFGMISDSEEWVYSQSHHDMVTIDGGFIDGGREYIRRGGDLEEMKYQVCKIKDGEFINE